MTGVQTCALPIFAVLSNRFTYPILRHPQSLVVLPKKEPASTSSFLVFSLLLQSFFVESDRRCNILLQNVAFSITNYSIGTILKYFSPFGLFLFKSFRQVYLNDSHEPIGGSRSRFKQISYVHPIYGRHNHSLLFK